MGGTTISTSDTKLSALKFQSSSYGGAVPVVYGQMRIPGNMIWYGGFKPVAKTSTTAAGGKGGGVKTISTTYQYFAAVMMGLCEGQISGVNRIWRGKNQYAGGPSTSELITATDTHTVPGIGGNRTPSVSGGTFSACITVTSDIGGGENSQSPMVLAEGSDYTRVGGVFTFGPEWAGAVMTILYQYLTASTIQTSLEQLNLSFAGGALGQGVWSYLTTNFPTQALGYSGTAYVYTSSYDLGSTAAVENHSFEIQAKMAYSISTTVPDADPALVMYDLLTSEQYGANFPAARIASTGQWSNYCRAANLLLSPALTEQMAAADAVVQMCKLTNTAPVWSEGVLKFIPFGDTVLTGNGATYTPNTTAVYDLNDNHFLDKDVPVRLMRKASADAFNQVQVEFWNRGNQYNVDIAEAKDQANIDVYGIRPAAVFAAHWCADPIVARSIAQLQLQRALYIRNIYVFKLSVSFSLLEPMDIVTITDAALGLSLWPVRITSIDEGEDEFTITCEDFPLGVATNTLYPSQGGAGFSHNYNASPGPVSAPVIFEGPGALSVNGLEIMVAASSANTMWGGANLWISLDGSNYFRAGTLNGGSRYGTLSAAATSGGTVAVQLVSGTLTSGSAADAAALNTLCYVGGANKEYLAHQGAALTGPGAYNLTGNVRGAYGSVAASHSSADPFVRVDDALGRSGPIDLSYVGKTIHVKLTSFNVYGGGEETLASVTDYTYVISGWQVLGNAGAAALLGIINASSDNILTAGEKPPIILEYANIINEQSGIDAQAALYQITTPRTTYNNAVTALTSYLGTLTTAVAWNNLTGDTTIVGTTFRTNFSNLYTARQALLNAISSNASQRLNTRANLLPNGGFESGKTGWTWSAPGTNNSYIDDSVWGRTLISVSQANGVGVLRSDRFPIQAGATYTISGDSICIAGTVSDCYFDMIYYDAAMAQVNDGGQNSIPSSHDFDDTSGRRNTHAVSSVAGAGAVWAVARYVWNATSITAVGARLIKVERGGLPATPYTNEGGVLSALLNITSDNMLSGGEKSQAILMRNDIVNAYPVILAAATNLKLSTTALTTAYNANTSYLSGLTPAWNDTTTNTPITGTAFRAAFTDYYAARDALQKLVTSGTSPGLTLTARGTCTLMGSNGLKNGGAGTWDSDIYSTDSYTGGAYATASPAQTNAEIMFGLNSDPLTDQNYTSLDFAWYFDTSANAYLFESGTNIGLLASGIVAGDVFAIIYDGVNVKCLKNGVVLATRVAPPGLTLFFDSSFATPGGVLKNIQFGPVSGQNIGGGNLLKNSSFEAFSTGSAGARMADFWTLYSSGSTGTITYDYTTVNYLFGSRALDITCSALAIGARVGAMQDVTYPVGIPGSRQVASVYFQATGGSFVTIQLNFFNGATFVSSAASQTLVASGGWQRVSFPLLVPGGTNHVNFFVLQDPGVAGINVLRVEGAMLQPGEVVTQFSPKEDEILRGVVGAVEIAPGGATGVVSTTVGSATATVQDGIPLNFTRFSNLANVVLGSGPAPELGAEMVEVLVTTMFTYNISGSGGLTQYSTACLQNNATFNAANVQDLDQAASGTSKVGFATMSNRFSVAGNAAVTFGLWVNIVEATPTLPCSNIEIRVEVIKR